MHLDIREPSEVPAARHWRPGDRSPNALGFDDKISHSNVIFGDKDSAPGACRSVWIGGHFRYGVRVRARKRTDVKIPKRKRRVGRYCRAIMRWKQASAPAGMVAMMGTPLLAVPRSGYAERTRPPAAHAVFVAQQSIRPMGILRPRGGRVVLR